jgi:Bacterial Ig domain
VWNIVGLLAMCLPVAVYILFLHHFALNVIFWDQWDDIYLVNHDWLNNLWAQHDDHRILFPNVVVIMLAQYANLNVVLEEFISAGCLVASTGLIVLAHHRRARQVSWLFYVPVVALLCSINQVQDTLWGFQLAWYMVLLALAATIYVIDHVAISWGHIALALVIAVVGSYSSLMGLFIWPVGLFILLQRRRRRSFVWAWCAGALLTTAIYFHDFTFNQPGVSGPDNLYALQHPLESLKFIIFSLGGSVGLPASPSWLPMAFGAVLLALSLCVLAAFGFRRDTSSGRTIGVALVIFGLFFVASTAFGRAWTGLFLQSRFNLFYFLLLAGSYLTLINPSAIRRSELAFTEIPTARSEPDPVRRSTAIARLGRGSWRSAMVIVVAVLLCVEVVSGSQQGVKEARAWSAQQRLAAWLTLNIKHVPGSVIDSAELWSGVSPSFTRTLAAEAAAKHLSLFGTQPPPDVLNIGRITPAVSMVAPRPEAMLRGRVLLVASASAPAGISRVTFWLRGGSLSHPEAVGHGAATSYVWITYWDSRTVPDGAYELQAAAQSSTGRSAVGLPLSVTVRN